MTMGALALHRLLLRAALALVHLFAWVFVFQYFYVESRAVGEALGNTLLTYALAQTIVVLLTPLSAMRLRRGFRNALVLGPVLLGVGFAALASAFSGDLGNIPLGITLFALAIGMYRAIYWVPYAVPKENFGSVPREWAEIGIALLPLLAGLSITHGGETIVTLLFVGAGLAMLSVIPAFFMRDSHEGYAWGYRETFHNTFDSRSRPLLYSSIASGIESAALLLLWPIAVFTFVSWSYPLLGAVMSLTLIFTMIARMLARGALESVPANVQPLLAASGWVMRLGVTGFIGAVLVDTYSHTSHRASSRGMDMYAYEQAADNHTYVDEYTAQKEIGMALGRVGLCVFAAGLLWMLPFAHALALSFLVAAGAAAYAVYAARAPKVAF